MSVHTNGNNLVVAGEFDRETLQRSCAAIHSLRKLSYRSINIDLSRVTRALASELLPFATHCRHLLVSGIDTMLELPGDALLARLFKNSNWAYLIDPQQFEQSQYSSYKHIPATHYTNADTHFEAVNQIVDKLLSSLEGFSRDQLAALEWAINEITDNVLNHAGSNVGGLVQLTTKRKSSIVEFVVCDAGVGIPRTLRDAHAHLTTDVIALDQASERVLRGIARRTWAMACSDLIAWRSCQMDIFQFTLDMRCLVILRENCT